MTENHPPSIATIVDSLLKPLTFSVKDDFAHIDTVKALEPLVIGLCRKAIAISPGEVKRDFEAFIVIFHNYDTLATEVKKKTISKALVAIRRIQRALQPTLTDRSCHADRNLDDIATCIDRLKTPLDAVKGIGPRLAGSFKKKGLETVEDALYFFPIRYEDRRNIRKISHAKRGEKELIIGKLIAQGEVNYGRRRVFEMALGDGTGFLKAKWFNYRLPYMKKYKVGDRLLLFGEIGVYSGQKEIVHPDVEAIEGDEDVSIYKTIIPIYSQIDNLHQRTIRKIIHSIVGDYVRYAVSGVPIDILRSNNLMDLVDALKEAHRPGDAVGEDFKEWLPRKSIVFDEFFCLEAGLALKSVGVSRETGIGFKTDSSLVGRLLESIPFTLTDAQQRVLGEIMHDMSLPHPMNRLLQGDVGSGKTIVAIMAALVAVENGYQVALMVPTELLAEQHYNTSCNYMEGLGINVAIITGSMSKKERSPMLKAMREGGIDIVIGTHALIQEDREFKTLGLVIVDEQHRFGVVQRASLKRKGLNPDTLVMTATPIPRTLSMTVFGDLDISTIDELPPCRKKVKTRVFRDKERTKVYDIVKREVSNGGQAYIVYPLVEESEELELRDATNMKAYLEKEVFRGHELELLHGRLKEDEKEAVMRRFKTGEIEVLVATTVIEVGIDVPNATVMLVEHAERFGLAQLHQLRGRVGRGERQSYCLLLAANYCTDDAYRRLKVMELTSDGFRLAEEDLKIRGPGDFLGTRQSGLPDLRIANPVSDFVLLQKARDEAFKIVKHDPFLSRPENAVTKAVVRDRWKRKLELATVG